MEGPYKNLRVWKESMELVSEVYRITRNFPNDEMYGITNQLRRASVSIPSNIAEGYGRSTNSDLVHFLYNSLGSSNEVDTQLIISFNIGYLNSDNFELLSSHNDVVNTMLRSLIYKRKNETSVKP